MFDRATAVYAQAVHLWFDHSAWTDERFERSWRRCLRLLAAKAAFEARARRLLDQAKARVLMRLGAPS